MGTITTKKRKRRVLEVHAPRFRCFAPVPCLSDCSPFRCVNVCLIDFCSGTLSKCTGGEGGRGEERTFLFSLIFRLD